MPVTHWSTPLRHGDRPLPCEVLAGQRPFGLENTRRCTEIDHLTAVFASAWPQVEDTIALADDFRVMFHHDDGVLVLLEIVQNTHQPTAVTRVQANARFVQNVQGIDQR